MQIKNLLNESQSIEDELLLMTSNGERLEAFVGPKLLELVRFLQARGPTSVAWGQLMERELWLNPANSPPAALVRIWVDWVDYAQLEQGLPKTHYRLQIKREKTALSEDVRAGTVEEVERMIHLAFGWAI
jgi:hypothetical protein